MLHKVGLLYDGRENLLPYAYRVSSAKNQKEIQAEFKGAFSRPCAPYFLGVWDTVATIGFVKPQEFSDAILNPDVSHARHAVSIDERRKKFLASLWNEKKSERAEERIVQVWFAGVHSDVGGWYDRRGLSHITVAWMMRQATPLGLRLRDGWDADLEPNPEGPQHKSRASYYMLWREVFRAIPEARILNDGRVLKSKIHRSVLARMGKNVPINDDKKNLLKSIKYEPKLPAEYEIVD